MPVDAFSTDLSNVSFGHSDSSFTKHSSPLNHLQCLFRFSNLVTRVALSATFKTPGI